MSVTAPNLLIRSVLPADFDQVVGIDQAITGQSRRGFYDKRLAAMVREPRAFVSLAADKAGVAGFVFAHILDGEFGGKAPVAVLDGLGVDAASRGSGVAGKLMAALEDELRRRGVRELQTQADWTQHTLVRFFAASGFALTAKLDLSREIDFASPAGDDEDPSRDRVPVRSLAERDLPALIGIDRKITGHDRTAYYKRKVAEVLNESGVRVSLVAEQDGSPVGFVMARVDYGEFGRAVPGAVIDTIGVQPDFGRHLVGSALMSQLLVNLASLRVERVNTRLDWDNFSLLGFLKRQGFRPSQRLSFARSV